MSEFPQEALEVARTIERLLAEDGPLTEVQIAERLDAAGVLPDLRAGYSLDEVLDQVVHSAMPLRDRRWVWLPNVLRSRIFTHHVTAPELAHDIVRLDGDLSPLITLLEDERYRRLADGTAVREVVLPYDAALLAERGAPADDFGQTALLFEPGRLASLGLAPGDLLALSLEADRMALSAVKAAVQPAVGLDAALAAAMPAEAEPDFYDTVVWEILVERRELLTEPTAPLEASITGLGYVKDVDWLAPPGFDFPGWRTGKRLDRLCETYDLDDEEALTVLAVIGLYERVAELYDAASEAERSGDAEQRETVLAALSAASVEVDTSVTGTGGLKVRDTLDLLDEPAVVTAVLAETELRGPAGAGALGMFAETLEGLAPPAARPALRWLQAKAYERLGALAEAEQTYAAAESLDTSWPLTLYDLARYASDRGDAERGLSLLRRAGAPADEPLVDLLERFRVTPRADLGRNDRCWCGSGRKYKQCHLHREQLPLEDRAAWLYQKAALCTREARGRDLVVDLADERSRYSEAGDALLAALEDPVVTDIALFEGGIFMDFVAMRGSLLPDDERALAEQWLLGERSVHEVVEVRPGSGLILRDVRTGEIHEVRERAARARVKPGELFCARVVPAGATKQIFGGSVSLVPHRRDEVLTVLDANPDPRDLVAFLTRIQLIDEALDQRA